MTDEKAPWPPDALNENALGALYNRAYEQATCDRGDSPQDGHQAACEAIASKIGVHPEHPSLSELRIAAEDLLRGGAHDGPCDNEDATDDVCDLHLETANVRKARLRAALDAFARARGEGLCTCTDGSCARQEAPA